MSDDQNIGAEAGTPAVTQTIAEKVVAADRPNLPRAPRTFAASTSYCAETAWVWQRARLVCAAKEPTA